MRGLLVVGVGLVPLEHRELGVVLVRDPLVAEVLAELVDLVDAADDEALEVELGGDAQVEVAVERVVVGREGARQGAAVERLQDRRLDLDEAAFVEPAAHLVTCGRAGRIGGGSPRWRSGRARAGGSASRRPRGRGTCRAAAAGSSPAAASGRSPARARRRAASPAPCPRPRRCRRGRARPAPRTPPRRAGRPGVQLDLPAAVAQVEEAGLAVTAPRDEPPGDPVPRVGLHPRRQPGMRRPHLADLLPLGELRGNGSIPASRNLSSFSRRSRRTSEASESLIDARAYRGIKTRPGRGGASCTFSSTASRRQPNPAPPKKLSGTPAGAGPHPMASTQSRSW